MRFHAFMFSLLLSFSSFAVMAGAGHDHGDGHSHDPVSQSQAEEVAKKSVAQLVDKGKIDGSWKSVGVSKSEQKKFGKNTEWVVTFANTAIDDPKKQTLYVFVSLTGEYIASNYTGN